jgi:CBS domain containing-hemolysin-like protein
LGADASSGPSGAIVPLEAASAQPGGLHESDNDSKDDRVLLWGMDHKNSVIVRSICCGLLVVLAGIVSGLTLSIFSIGADTLRGFAESPDASAKRLAKGLLGLAKHEHWVLVTLLVCNAGAVEALPLMLDPLMPNSVIVGVVISTLLVLIFSEIIPQSVFVRFAFPVAGRLVPFVWFIMVVTAPISWSLAKLLDFVVGHRMLRNHRRTELREMVYLNLRERMRQAATAELDSHASTVSDDDFEQSDVEYLLFRAPSGIHENGYGEVSPTKRDARDNRRFDRIDSDASSKSAAAFRGMNTAATDKGSPMLPAQEGLLSIEEARMMVGALSIAEMQVKEVMKGIPEVFWLREDAEFSPDVVEKIFSCGYSRIPIARRHGAMSASLESGTVELDEAPVVPPFSFGQVPPNEEVPPLRLSRYFLCRELVCLMHETRDAPLKRPCDFELHDAIVVHPDDSLLSLYDKFVAGTVHLAVVREFNDAQAPAVGMVTYSDVIAVITRTQFHDETDLANHAALQMRIKGIHAARHGLQGGNTSHRDDENQHRRSHSPGVPPGLRTSVKGRHADGRKSPATPRTSLIAEPVSSYYGVATEDSRSRSRRE